MKKVLAAAVIVWTMVGAAAAFSQVKMTRDQMMFYTSDWKGDRFPDGRPKVPDNLLERLKDLSLEDIIELEHEALAETGYITGASGRNWDSYGAQAVLPPGLPAWRRAEGDGGDRSGGSPGQP